MIFEFLFGSPLKRMQRYLRVVEKAILSAQITAKDRRAIPILQK